MSLFAELKRRKMIQWALAYVTAAWLLAQILEVVEGPWGIPAGWVRALHIALAAGVPVAAIVAWYHGERGRQRVTGREILAMAVVLALAGLGVMFLSSLDSRISRQAAVSVAERAETALLPVASDLPRLAVLAFTNLGAPDDGFFADGITEELNSRLSGLTRLAVISRSSASMYRDSGQTPREIGEALGADFILNGTVRWARPEQGTLVRVTPELVRVADDTQVWSGQFDRKFEEVFRIQSEIAGQVVAALDVALSGTEERALGRPPTSNPLAYEAYLKAIQTLPEGHGPEEDFRQARLLFEQALKLDPGFALAWIGLADADLGLYWFGYDHRPVQLETALAAITRARELEPESVDAAVALGDYYYRSRDFDHALEEFSRAFARRPNDSRVLRMLGYIWRRQGLFEQAIENLETAAALDPLDAYGWIEVAYTHLVVGDYGRALELHARALEIDPSEEWNYLFAALSYWARAQEGDLARARKALEAFPDPRSAYPLSFWILQHLFEGDPQGALALLRSAGVDVVVTQGTYEPVSLLIGSILRMIGRDEEARDQLLGALAHLEARVAANPEDFRLHMALGRVYADLGRAEDAVRAGRRGVSIMPLQRDALLGSSAQYDLIRIYATLGETELALDTMAHMLARPASHHGFWLTRNPEFVKLWENPRFEEIYTRSR
jgi:TolB-like protein/cytochrome c-type biogenesis protein CcmH/NrfG